MTERDKKLLLYLLLPVCSLSFLCWTYDIIPGKNENSPTRPSSETGLGKVSIGEISYVDKHGCVAVDKDAHREFLNSAMASDAYGFVNLQLSGRVFCFDERTRVQVIETGVFIYKIRVLEGKHMGRAGWIAYEHVTKR